MKAELFDRYVHEVGRHLPRRMRADVAAELHSLLTDALQDRIAAGGGAEDGPAVEALQVAILQEFGPPVKVADRYAPRHSYLIGPRFFDLYRIVIAAVLGAIALSQLVLLGLAAWSQGGSLGTPSSLGAWLGGLLHAAVIGFASVTLTFAILERVLASALDEGEEEAGWDPRTLPEVHDPTRSQASERVVEIIFLVIALLVFNLFPGWIGINYPASVNGGPAPWYSVPLLSPTFRTTYLPWLDALWVLSIGLNLALLRRGRWERLTRLADFLLAAGGAVFLYRLVSGPPILTVDAIETASLRQLIESMVLPAVRIGLIVALVIAGVEAVRKVYLVFADSKWAVPRRPN